jgi:hypothetical protein
MLGHHLKTFETLTVDFGFVNDSTAQVQAQSDPEETKQKGSWPAGGGFRQVVRESA